MDDNASRTESGQVSVEFVLSVTLLVLVFIAVTYIDLNLRREANQLNFEFNEDVQCSNLADTINAVYARGDDASTVVTVFGNFTLAPGRIVLHDGPNDYLCPIDNGALENNTIRPLTSGEYTVRRRGGWVKIEIL